MSSAPGMSAPRIDEARGHQNGTESAASRQGYLETGTAIMSLAAALSENSAMSVQPWAAADRGWLCL